MKKQAMIVLLVAAISGGAFLSAPARTHAQSGNEPILLDDATPSIDVIVNPAPNTTGVVAVDINQASVKVVNGRGTVVFQMADARAHKLELRFAPNSGSHTLTIERLAGVSQAYARVESLAAMADSGTGTLVTNNFLSEQQQVDIPLNASVPSNAAAVNIPFGKTDTITLSFPGAPVSAQIVDQNGTAVALLTAGLIDGLSLTLDGGIYSLSLLNTNPSLNTVANISVQPAIVSDMVANVPAASTAQNTSAVQQNNTCTVTVVASSVNLRSGPGTGYSILGYGFRGDQLLVGGTNTDHNWLLVGTAGGSAWIASEMGQLDSQCTNLTVYDTPTREAPNPEVVVQQPYYNDDQGEHEHEGFDD